MKIGTLIKQLTEPPYPEKQNKIKQDGQKPIGARGTQVLLLDKVVLTWLSFLHINVW